MLEDHFFSSEELKARLPLAHPTAQVARTAEVDKSVRIGAFASVGSDVKLAENVVLHAGAVVDGDTFVGSETVIHSYATIGTTPQDLKYAGEKTRLRIGSRNQIREYVNISIGTKTGHHETILGNNNLIMAYSHIAHDCIIGNHVIIANGVQLAGHAEVGDHSVFGGMSGVHQFCKVGTYAMVGAGAIVVQDVPPFCMVQGDRAKPIGLNVVGLRRSPIPAQEVSLIKKMYHILYKENLTLEDACQKISQEVESCKSRDVFLNFLQKCHRGIVR